jgi:hypothetical protein
VFPDDVTGGRVGLKKLANKEEAPLATAKLDEFDVFDEESGAWHVID